MEIFFCYCHSFKFSSFFRCFFTLKKKTNKKTPLAGVDIYHPTPPPPCSDTTATFPPPPHFARKEMPPPEVEPPTPDCVACGKPLKRRYPYVISHGKAYHGVCAGQATDLPVFMRP